MSGVRQHETPEKGEANSTKTVEIRADAETKSPRAPKRGWLLVEQPECKHTPSPTGYLQWHSWAERKAKTHRQVRCSVCGLWAIWIPKTKEKAA